MRIEGPIVNKTVIIPEHTVEVLDETAYWNLDYYGEYAPLEEDNPPMVFYSKVAWPTIQAAQRQFQLERQAREASRQPARTPEQKAKAHAYYEAKKAKAAAARAARAAERE